MRHTVDEWNRIEYPEINFHTLGQLVLNKSAKIIQLGMNSPFKKWY